MEVRSDICTPQANSTRFSGTGNDKDPYVWFIHLFIVLFNYYWVSYYCLHSKYINALLKSQKGGAVQMQQ